METPLEMLKILFRQWSGSEAAFVEALPPSGSQRRYFRFRGNDGSAIGAINPIREENRAFLHFTKVFREQGLPVAEILGENEALGIYLLEDLGDQSLLGLAEGRQPGDNLPDGVLDLYKISLSELARMQASAGRHLDYNLCYPRSAFDRRAILWDLNYFKYYFLKLHTDYHEDRLEDDFDTLAGFLGAVDGDYFMYRDFQARNILVRDGRPFFIDYQGGRKGPLHYDVASLLFQVKADLPPATRDLLLDAYLSAIGAYTEIDKTQFRREYELFVLVRLLQTLGAYGFRGLIERRPHFLQSIPYALKTLRWWLDNTDPVVSLPELVPALRRMVEVCSERYPPNYKEITGLTVRISSFSYKQGIPSDPGGHGGGFVFDCRALPNPGREERYRPFNGKDEIIQQYLESLPEVAEFIGHAERMTASSIETYLDRGFNHLLISFGCTGGQHRSVYCAEQLALRLQKKFPAVSFEISHPMLRNIS